MQQFKRKLFRRVSIWREKWHIPTKETQAVLNAWKPKGKPETVLLRWFMTEWCNYNCAYCPQNHNRMNPIGDGFTAHAFDNFKLEAWLDAFDRHFTDTHLSLVLTGGEPMLDFQHMHPFLKHLTSREQVKMIRIDTNASWKPEKYLDIDLSKIILMCTYHPGQVDEAVFYEKIKRLLELGFQIGMINYVMDADNTPMYQARFEKFAQLGVYLHPNPLWGKQGLYADADLALMKSILPPADYIYRNELESPKHKPCYFPSLAYEMDARGRIHAGCLTKRTATFFDPKLPQRPAGRVSCPHASCVCLDKYSFLEGVDRNNEINPLNAYRKALWQIHRHTH